MDVTTETFETEVIERSHELPVVVDFWAAWCGPCRALGPVLERESEQRAGQLVLAKVDVDAHPALAQRYQVRGIPAVKAFRNGQVVSEFVGALSPTAVERFLDELSASPTRDRVLEELRADGDLADVVSSLEAGDDERALELLLEGIGRADALRKERLRDLMVALFGDLGQEHPLSLRYRRRLATMLY